ncbi:uncharacterized protein LOC115018779 [Tachysurus ichikawai]
MAAIPQELHPFIHAPAESRLPSLFTRDNTSNADHTLDEHPLAAEPITMQTGQLTLCIGPHTEHLSLYVTWAHEDYWYLQEVFSKQRTHALPAHHPLDCTINLVPGTATLRNRLFSLSRLQLLNTCNRPEFSLISNLKAEE